GSTISERRRLARRATARRDRQGRHRQDHCGREPGTCAGQQRQARAAVRGRGATGHRPAVRRTPAALRRASDREWAGHRVHRRRKCARARDRCRVGAPGVPGDVLPPRSSRPRTRAVRGDRLRHDHRPWRAGRAAHRQAVRGGSPQPAPQEGAGVRRHRLGRTPDRSDRTVPERQQRACGSRQGRTGPQAGRHGDDPAALEADGGPPGHGARGHAGAGDRRRHRAASGGAASGRSGDREPGPSPCARRGGARQGDRRGPPPRADRARPGGGGSPLHSDAGRRVAGRGPRALRAARARGRATATHQRPRSAHLRVAPAVGRRRPRRPLRAGSGVLRAGHGM
ncbi:MAG: Arsenical pump-driving ATPase TEMP, partial [uncultured Nocardioidaceae bacterium]